VVVCLNMKRTTVYGGVYVRDGDAWARRGEPRLATVDELLEGAPRPAVLIGDPLPEPPDDAQGVTVLPAASARARSGAVWRLGRAAASRGAYTEPARLLPLYVRPPEAVEIWNKRAKAAAGAEQQSNRAAEQQIR
jgi:tRNA A37 threonylcarbamoyladenosine modification protein TsaB